MYSNIRRAFALALGIAAAAPVFGYAPRVRAAAPEPPAPALIWMISARSLDRLARLPGAAPLVRRFFGSPFYSILVDGPDAGASRLPAVHSASFASYRSLRSALDERAGTAPPWRTAVLDLEAWPQTPRGEQLQPVRYYRLAGRLAARRGITLIATPSPSLAGPRGSGEDTVYTHFLKSGLIGEVAAAADVFEIQAQGLGRSPGLYASFVAAAAVQARAANPAVTIIAGLSTNPGGRAVPARDLYRDVEAAEPFVDGFWLNVPARSLACPRCGVAQPRQALALLRRLSRRTAASPASAPARPDVRP